MRVAVLGLAAAASLVGQCTLCSLFNQATCGTCYTLNGGVPPIGAAPLGTFLALAEANFAAIRLSVAGLPQPHITLTAQVWPCLASKLSASVTVFGPHCIQYANLLKTYAGVTTQDINLWRAALASSAEYQAEGVSAPYNIAGDCAGNAGAPYLARGVTPGAGSGPHCWALYYLDGMFTNAISQGIVMRGGDTPMTDDLTACGFSGWPGTLVSPVISEPQYEACVIPLHKAMISRWANLMAFQVIEEPTAGMAGVQVFSVSDVGNFIVHDSVALKAINPALLIGAAGTGPSWPTNLDTAYWADWTNTGGSTYPAMDFFVLDLFVGSFNLGTSNTAYPGHLYYAAELADFASGYVAQARRTGKPIPVGQSDAPIWGASGGLVYQPNAILGQCDAIWDTSGLFNGWISTIVPWASAHGIESFADFITLPLFSYTTNQSNDNAVTGYSGIAMSSLAPTDSAAVFRGLAIGAAASLQGNAYLSGAANFGH